MGNGSPRRQGRRRRPRGCVGKASGKTLGREGFGESSGVNCWFVRCPEVGYDQHGEAERLPLNGVFRLVLYLFGLVVSFCSVFMSVRRRVCLFD